ncbi:phenylalanine--tRNA ligase subunit beta [Haliangium ochraceum]|uniref:Phenylalanine--tRNA ligase beta subunit n=1 Tax=Haliangium ochraceum (strain DSM 14365 / JCM 11303 / SMP-2) TaxID=502025 RepID=D0LY93_HALO1|nr:phenylalanine--tRNA ligase subunit beta [Haliangium ochraceum]ACY16243.1 phenylalanyl-tRNA synthetase, beta subunit [Haliangium ochraceum DSM 14365]
MRVVWSWLRELVELDRDLSAEEAARALTGAGFEVEAVEGFGQEVRGVVVAEVVAKRPHPEAERLTLVDVIDTPGGEPVQVVCGAPNVPEPGGRVLWAKPGSHLPGIGELKTREIKGVASPGMLCAEDELGLGDDHGGIIVLDPRDVMGGAELLGAGDALDLLGLRGHVFEIDIHANRGDALGHLGLAREFAAAVGGRLRVPAVFADAEAVLADSRDSAREAAELVSVDIAAEDGCPRYTARVIEGVRVGPSPLWMQQRLRAVGVRPLSNLVDITNYVMFELGQPLHAFDIDRVAGPEIRVRWAQDGERMTTLDDVERQLTPEDLLICDANGPVALAGVMGGAETEVGEGTTRVLLESASFDASAVRRTARRLGLNSEASARFGRGVDPNLAEAASARAADLMCRLAGGRVAEGVVDAYVRRAEPTQVSLRASRASALLGIEVTRDDAAAALAGLGIASEPVADDEDRLSITVPTHRPDLAREVDIIEDIVRLRGFDAVPATMPRGQVPRQRVSDTRPARARTALLAAGLSEAITFGFCSRERLDAMGVAAGDPRTQPIALRNPMSAEQAVMRTMLLPNLLSAVRRNLSYDVRDVGLFEVGSVFLGQASDSASEAGDAALPDEPTVLAGVLTGQRPGWLESGGEVDFFDAKGAVEAVLAALLPDWQQRASFVADGEIPYFHPGVCARIEVPGEGDAVQIAGHVGEIHPQVRKHFGLEPRCFAFELRLAAFPAPVPAQMQAIPRYPAVTRDISMLMDAAIPASRVREVIDARAESLLERVLVLEDYRDPAHVPAGKKGMLWSITYRSAEGTLTDAQVDKAHGAIVEHLLATLPAERR